MLEMLIRSSSGMISKSPNMQLATKNVQQKNKRDKSGRQWRIRAKKISEEAGLAEVPVELVLHQPTTPP